jgi:hypothetical protein
VKSGTSRKKTSVRLYWLRRRRIFICGREASRARKEVYMKEECLMWRWSSRQIIRAFYGFYLFRKAGYLNDFSRFTAPKAMFKTRYASYIVIARYEKLTPPPQDIPYECTLVSFGLRSVQRLTTDSRFPNRGIYALTF